MDVLVFPTRSVKLWTLSCLLEQGFQEWSMGDNQMQKKCLNFHKQRNHQMHTTNNVPQSRCRAFLIYGEPSKMGRWSKRRWRHAEGLFSLLTSQTREACESVRNTHKNTLPHSTQRHNYMHKCKLVTAHYLLARIPLRTSFP